MVADENPAETPETQARRREPLTPAKRRRLQKIFEHGSKQMAQENHDYAAELFEQCVLGDPSNLIYVQNYVGNLQRKYNNNKSGSKLAQFKELGARSAVKKAINHGEWDEAIKHGLKVLAVNPWDVHTLTAMATASEKSGDDEVELFYLKCALDTNPKDPAVNRQCAHALAAREQFDQAIACWHRVVQVRPDDEEAQHEIGRLAVEKTIVRGGYDDRDEAKKLAGERKHQPQLAQQPQRELSQEEQLQQKIRKDPTEPGNYRELAEIHLANEDYAAAEEVYAAAVEAVGENTDIRDRLEDVQMRRLRQQMTQAEDGHAREQFRKQLIQKELEVYKNRCERFPNNLGLKYDLGYRYQLDGQYPEAIKEYQQARNDPGRRGLCMLRLGQCFKEINQNRLAMTHYEAAIKQIPDREEEQKKEALYGAVELSMAMEDLETAETYLTSLAELDFAYKDVSTLLDNIAEKRKNV